MKERRGWIGMGPVLLIALLLGIALSVIAGSSLAQEPDGNTIPTDSDSAPNLGVNASPESVDGPGRVLIIQDSAPWNTTAIQRVLAAHNISYDLIASSQLAAADLSVYEMIINPSDQPAAYVTNWNKSIDKIETYARNGGKVWQSTSYDSATELTPGGIVSNPDTDGASIVTHPGHRWVRGVPSPIIGSWASQQSFSDIYRGAALLAVDSSSGRPVLLDYKYGAGRVFLTGLTMEFSWNAKWDAAPILDNSIVEMLGARVLLVQDSNAWGDGIQQVLNNHSVGFNVTGNTQIGTVGLTPYDLVIISNAQTDAFNTAINAYISKFSNYVAAGGKLWHGTVTFGAVTPKTVGGVVSHHDPNEPVNYVASKGHRWMVGVPNTINGTSASHADFTSIYPGSRIVAVGKDSGDPTLLDYNYGSGRVLLSGQTPTHAYQTNLDNKPMLENSIMDLLSSRVHVAIIAKNVCGQNPGGRETEPNDTRPTANPICLEHPVVGSPNDEHPADELDYFSFYWDAKGTLQVDLTNFVADAQLILYYGDTLVTRDFTPDASNNFTLTYGGAAGPGTYYALALAGANHPISTDYTLTATVK